MRRLERPGLRSTISLQMLADRVYEPYALFQRQRTFQRTSYRPGVFCQFDLWQPSREIPVGSVWGAKIRVLPAIR
jgi:hypothetical protein